MSTNQPLDSMLQHQNAKQFNLSTNQLEQYFAQAEFSLRKNPTSPNSTMLAPNPELAIQFVSRFGMKTPQDVIVFLNSKAGDATRAMIGSKIAEIEAIKATQQREMLEQELLTQSQLAFLLLGLLYEQEADAEKLNEFIQKQIDKSMHDHALANKKSDDFKETVLENIAVFRTAEKELGDLLQHKLADSEILEKQLTQVLVHIEQQIERLNHQYNHYDQSIDETNELVASQDTPDSKVQAIQDKIDHLTKLNDNDAKTVGELLEAGKEKEAKALLITSNARNLQISNLNDILSVLNDKKKLYNSQGEQIKDFTQADFILPAEKKIVKKDDKYYILPATQDLDNLPAEDQEKAHQQFKQLKPEIMGVKKLVQHNRELETRECQDLKKPLVERSERLQKEIFLLANQLTKIQSAIVGQEGTLSNQIQTPKPSLKLTPMFSSPSPKAKESELKEQHLTQSYRHMLQLMSKLPSKDSLNWLKRSLTGETDKKLQQQLDSLVAYQPIPATLIKKLLSRSDLTDLWLAASRQNETLDTAPTPFKTQPVPRLNS